MADPVTRRLIGLFKGLSELYAQWKEKDFLARQIAIILEAVREELEDDGSIFESPSARLMILNFAKLMEWTVHGDLSQLPEELWPIACQIDGLPVPVKPEPLFEYRAINPANAGQTVQLPEKLCTLPT